MPPKELNSVDELSISKGKKLAVGLLTIYTGASAIGDTYLALDEYLSDPILH